MNLSKMIVAYDGSPLADRALTKAMQMATLNDGTEIHVVYVIDLPTFAIESLNYDEIVDGMYHYGNELMKRAEDQLAGLRTGSYRTSMPQGNPSSAILDYAKEHHADQIIMGSRGHGGLKELFLGSVSHDIVQRSPIPVFIVK